MLKLEICYTPLIESILKLWNETMEK